MKSHKLRAAELHSCLKSIVACRPSVKRAEWCPTVTAHPCPSIQPPAPSFTHGVRGETHTPLHAAQTSLSGHLTLTFPNVNPGLEFSGEERVSWCRVRSVWRRKRVGARASAGRQRLYLVPVWCLVVFRVCEKSNGADSVLLQSASTQCLLWSSDREKVGPHCDMIYLLFITLTSSDSRALHKPCGMP